MKRIVLVFGLACGATPAPQQQPPLAKPVLPDVPFDQLDQDQRAEFMRQKVVPAMEPVFKQHDAKFSELGCKTCHGKQADEGHFEMPNPELPKLTFNDMSKFKQADIEWMKSEVKPAMAKLLSRPEFGPDTPKGFGCTNCHLSE